MSYSSISASDALNQLTSEETLEFNQVIADGVTYDVNDFNTKEDLFALYLTAGTVYVRNTLNPSVWYPIGDNIASNVATASQIVDSLNGVNTQVMTLSKQLSPAMEAALSNSGANVGSTALAPITNTELVVQSTGKTLQVTTKGILTKVPYAKALTAGAAALGVGLGIGFVENNPELATKISNKIFGTNIDPEEIVNIVENTSVWANIVDGATFLAEDFIQGLKEVFIENNVYTNNGPNEFGSWDSTISSTSSGIISYKRNENTWTKGKYVFNIYADAPTDTLCIVSYGTNTWNVAIASKSPDLSTTMSDYKVGFSSNISDVVTPSRDVGVSRQGRTVGDNVFYIVTGGASLPTGYDYRPEVTGTRFSVSGSGKHRIAVAASSEYKLFGLTYNEWIWSLLNGSYLPGTTLLPDVILEDGATYPDSSKTLAEDYPTWWNRKTTSDTLSDGTEKDRNWLPISTNDPNNQNKAQDGTLDDSSQLEDIIGGIDETVDENENIDPNYDPQEQPYPNPNPAPGDVLTPVTPDVPTIDNSDGITPDPTVPILTTVVTSGLSYVYNPTLAQTKQLGRKLWTLDFVENLKKIFVDPMQAIIGMHVLYATPKTGSTEDIVLGYYNTNVQSKVVTNQYVTIDCGTISVNEYFKDARDYEPYTKVSAYMPFIGVVDLKADDIINSYINVSYNIDVLTGTCLGIIKVLKGSAEAAIYQYVGNCAVTVPLSTGNYTAVLTALLSVASSAIGGAAIGGVAGAAFGGLKGAAINASRAKLNVQQSGNLGANAGALGIRKPYLIIRRPVTNDAYAYNVLYGYPAFKWKKLGGCKGFTKVRSVHLDNVKCSDDEKNMIIEALYEGVIL